MENDIALYATTYVAFRVAIIAAFANLLIILNPHNQQEMNHANEFHRHL